ncbi:MAG: IS21 family transposase [Chlamydiae bacterium]|nr:IS21 family transposase [Chlamydiota bacterium]
MEEIIQKIKYLKEVQNLSFRQIESQTGISRKRCSKIYCGILGEKRSKNSLLDPYRSLIAHWFSEYPRLKAIQVFERLRERGINVSYMRVVQYTQGFRKNKSKLYWPLEFLPGEEAQVDWFFVNHPKLGKLSGFALILSYSRYLFAHLFQRHSFEFFIEGHLMAFQSFEGYPRAFRYDNLKSVVLKRDPLKLNPNFLDFARHYGFEIRLCNVAAGNEKGRVERVIRSLRDTFFNTANDLNTLQALNLALHEWVFKKNQTVHRSTNQMPEALKSKENLKPLPQIPWPNLVIHPPKQTTKTGFLIFDANRYSVPDYLCGHALSLRTFVDHIEIYDSKSKLLINLIGCSTPKPQNKTSSSFVPQIGSLKVPILFWSVMPELESPILPRPFVMTQS